jgi:hypothetical protein
MQWNEISKRTAGIIICLLIFFAGAVIVLTVGLIRRSGGDEVAKVVQNAVQTNHILDNGGTKIISDKLLVTFMEGISQSRKNEIAAEIGAKLEGASSDDPNSYVVAVQPSTARTLRQQAQTLKGIPDVIDAQLIPVE